MENNIKPSCWGPPAWAFLHSVSFGYPDYIENPSNNPISMKYKHFFNNVGEMLPCEWCKKHYREHITKYPIDNFLGSKKDITRWLYDLHNVVNEMLKVPKENIPSYEEVVNMYNSFSSSNCKNSGKQVCSGGLDAENKRCILTYITDDKNKKIVEMTINNNIFRRCWWLILIIILLIIVIIFMISKKK